MVFWQRGSKSKGKDGAADAAAAEAPAPAAEAPGSVDRRPPEEPEEEEEDSEAEALVDVEAAAEKWASEQERGGGDLDVDEDLGTEDDAEDAEDEGGEVDEEEEPEEDMAAVWEKFEANLAAMHPKLKDTRGLVADEELVVAVRARRNPAISDNARFVMGSRPVDKMGAREVPPIVGVMGHRGAGGNQGINGIYELYPGFFHDRPVYQKVLEKRLVSDLLAAPPGGLVAQRDPPRSPRSRVLAKRNQREFIMKAPVKKPGFETMWPVPNGWFLFFDKGIACWCIGSAVGHTEIYARCPGTEELIPDRLERWQVWDCGLHAWYDHASLRSFKGGSVDR
mmetsp:Transcript_23054/g.64898  ORF Transcript_23054/g.64898 Transcript_23054/m.64898 type:complete len:337 (-) Transcript_23054:79-1089(-)